MSFLHRRAPYVFMILGFFKSDQTGFLDPAVTRNERAFYKRFLRGKTYACRGHWIDLPERGWGKSSSRISKQIQPYAASHPGLIDMGDQLSKLTVTEFAMVGNLLAGKNWGWSSSDTKPLLGRLLHQPLIRLWWILCLLCLFQFKSDQIRFLGPAVTRNDSDYQSLLSNFDKPFRIWSRLQFQFLFFYKSIYHKSFPIL